MPIEGYALSLLACPVCKHRLRASEPSDGYCCSNQECQSTFPTVNGTPVLINEKNSIFRISSYTAVGLERETRKGSSGRTIKRFIKSLVPTITHSWVARRNYARLSGLLREMSSQATVLVVGGGELGEGIEILLSGDIRLVETDVQFGSRTSIVADGHDLPFLAESFDGVVIQAVLEHVLDPYRCVEEIHRVLKPQGLIYAETPFMYPVHLGCYDFTRFSRSAHRRLFRYFTEIDGGLGGGPGQALAWSIRGFVASFSSSALVQHFATFGLPFLTFWLKYCDYFLVRQPQAEDFASTVYLLGRKAESAISEQEVVDGHWTRAKRA